MKRRVRVGQPIAEDPPRTQDENRLRLTRASHHQLGFAFSLPQRRGHGSSYGATVRVIRRTVGPSPSSIGSGLAALPNRCRDWGTRSQGMAVGNAKRGM